MLQALLIFTELLVFVHCTVWSLCGQSSKPKLGPHIDSHWFQGLTDDQQVWALEIPQFVVSQDYDNDRELSRTRIAQLQADIGDHDYGNLRAWKSKVKAEMRDRLGAWKSQVKVEIGHLARIMKEVQTIKHGSGEYYVFASDSEVRSLIFNSCKDSYVHHLFTLILTIRKQNLDTRRLDVIDHTQFAWEYSTALLLPVFERIFEAYDQAILSRPTAREKAVKEKQKSDLSEVYDKGLTIDARKFSFDLRALLSPSTPAISTEQSQPAAPSKPSANSPAQPPGKVAAIPATTTISSIPASGTAQQSPCTATTGASPATAVSTNSSTSASGTIQQPTRPTANTGAPPAAVVTVTPSQPSSSSGANAVWTTQRSTQPTTTTGAPPATAATVTPSQPASSSGSNSTTTNRPSTTAATANAEASAQTATATAVASAKTAQRASPQTTTAPLTGFSSAAPATQSSSAVPSTRVTTTVQSTVASTANTTVQLAAQQVRPSSNVTTTSASNVPSSAPLASTAKPSKSSEPKTPPARSTSSSGTSQSVSTEPTENSGTDTVSLTPDDTEPKSGESNSAQNSTKLTFSGCTTTQNGTDTTESFSSTTTTSTTTNPSCESAQDNDKTEEGSKTEAGSAEAEYTPQEEDISSSFIDRWKRSMQGWTWIQLAGMICTCGILVICLLKLSLSGVSGQPSHETKGADYL